MPVVTARLQPI